MSWYLPLGVALITGTSWIFLTHYEVYGPYDSFETIVENHSLGMEDGLYVGQISVRGKYSSGWLVDVNDARSRFANTTLQWLTEHYPIGSKVIVYKYRDLPTHYLSGRSIYPLYLAGWVLFESLIVISLKMI